tara:strand:+ start:881 stop:1513 length:633 start_codon:yes stop_codon:yes gene_type:complete
MINIYNQDCMEAMKEMLDNQFDLAIVDPPYGIDASRMTMGRGSGNDTKKHDTSKKWDITIPLKIYFDEVQRVSKNQIIWGGNYFLDFLGCTRCVLIWDKKDYNSDFADGELAWTSFNKNLKIFQRARSRNNDNKNKIHPTQKPVALYEWLLMNYAKQGDKILDTHLGSGSIAIACHNLGYDLTGYEIDKEYFEAAQKRINIHKQQKRLFI